ncbi:ABC transporter ATP-binding protein [Corynebacterium sp. S7]
MIEGHSITVPGILSQINFIAESGQVTGIIGPNGAGKSTLLSALSQLHDKARGTVEVDGTAINGYSDRQRARLIATFPQNTSLDFDFTAREVVAFGRHPHRGRLDRETDHDRNVVREAIARVGAESFADRPVPQLSGGERQLTHIARALAQATPVMLLDEPVSALDLRHQLVVLNLLHSLAKKGSTVVTVLHDLSQAARFCDQLVLIANGQVCATGPPEKVLLPDILAQTYGVHASIRRNPDTNSVDVTALYPVSFGDKAAHSATTPPSKE